MPLPPSERIGRPSLSSAPPSFSAPSASLRPGSSKRSLAKSRRAQPIAAPASGGIERGAIRGLTRDRAKVTQLLDEALALPANEAVEGISGHEVEYGSARPARQYAHDASRTRQRLATNGRLGGAAHTARSRRDLRTRRRERGP